MNDLVSVLTPIVAVGLVAAIAAWFGAWIERNKTKKEIDLLEAQTEETWTRIRQSMGENNNQLRTELQSERAARNSDRVHYDNEIGQIRAAYEVRIAGLERRLSESEREIKRLLEENAALKEEVKGLRSDARKKGVNNDEANMEIT